MKELYDMYPGINLQGFKVPEYYNWSMDWIDYLAKTQGDRNALIFYYEGKRRDFSFREISDLSSRFAFYLSEKGVTKGDRILLMLGNVPMMWISVVAILKIGGVIVPTATSMTSDDVKYRIESADISGVITDDINISKFSGMESRLKVTVCAWGNDGKWDTIDHNSLSSIRKLETGEKTRSDEPALIYFTSGTTGLPKMVLHTHSSYPLGHYSTAMWIGIEKNGVHWNISSPGWAKHAWSSIFAPWNVAAATVAFHYEGRFDPAEHLRLIGELGISSICASPTVWRMFIIQDMTAVNLKSLKTAASAGEPLNPEIIARFRDVSGTEIRDGYGQTETVLMVGNFPGVKIKPGSMGKPSPFFRMSIADDDGKRLGNNEEGNIVVETDPERPIPLMVGYMNDEEKNKEIFKEGLYFTGDRAFRDDDGYYWYVGRSDDVIKSSGYRIGPFEVESALMEHGSVVESAAVASPDQVRGAVVKCFVVLKKGIEPSQELADRLSQYVAEKTGPYKHPRKIQFIDSLDQVKTISGKIRRKDLKEMEYGKRKNNLGGIEFITRPLREAKEEDEEDE
ncbi:MAG: AMP-binding protein [Candidatus Thermoplasmatota archaeon]|jgi:acyl-coenzyme A synthetase/AMP-(fatty) acid ligase|nr:AMP-binding protein [Candidatus Thermoplasmatota archaeon]